MGLFKKSSYAIFLSEINLKFLKVLRWNKIKKKTRGKGSFEKGIVTTKKFCSVS